MEGFTSADNHSSITNNADDDDRGVATTALNGVHNTAPEEAFNADQTPLEEHPLLPANGHSLEIQSNGDKKKNQNFSENSKTPTSQQNKDDDHEVILTPQMEDEILGPKHYSRGGLGVFKGKEVQKLACPQVYVVLFSCVMLSQSMYFYYSNGTISTIEKRFRLPSKTTGFISTGNDILQMLLALHVAHICGNGHRPRWMALGMAFTTIACVLTTLPHIIFGAGTYRELAQQSYSTANSTTTRDKGWSKCGNATTETEKECQGKSSEIGSEQVVVITLQFIGQLVTGLGQTIVSVIGMSYLDESVSKEKVPFYFGLTGAMRIFGPVSAYSMAAWALRQWVEVGVEPSITPSHPHWVGAWWIGYLVIGGIALVPTWGLLLLPRQMPSTRKRVLERLRAAAKKGNATFSEYREKLRPAKKPQMGEMLSGLKRLLKNRFFVAITVNQLVFYFCLVGYLVFSSKYIENNFMISAAKANEYIALVGLVASLVGWLGTGSLLSFLRPATKNIMYMTLSVSILSTASYLYMMTLRCEQKEVIGLDQVLKSRGSHTPALDALENKIQNLSLCMDNCECPTRFSPVCVDGEHTFYSACHAGCTEKRKENNTNVYEDCSCINHINYEESKIELLSVTPTPDMSAPAPSVVVDGRCETECSAFWWYLGIVMVSKVLQIANRNIAHCLFFRAMDERDKDLGLGLLSALASVSFIVGPIIIGAVIDYSCLLWEWTCGRRGFCWLYDLDTYAATLHGIPAGGMILCFLTELLLLKWRKDIDFFGDKEKATLGLLDVMMGKDKNVEKKKKEKSNSEETTTLNVI